MTEREGADATAGGEATGEFDPGQIVGRIAEYDESLAEDVRRIIERGVELHETADELEAELERKDARIEELEGGSENGETADSGAEPREGDDRVEELKDRLDQREDEIEDLKNRLKRKQADFENYKKRAERKRERIQERATEDLIERLLDVRDNLRRAIDNEHPDIQSLKDGVEMTLREFDRVLDDENVTEIDPDEGIEVDPERHEVMMKVDSDLPEGVIADVYSPGYEMAEEVIRPAQVTVSNGSGEGDGEEATAAGDETEE